LMMCAHHLMWRIFTISQSCRRSSMFLVLFSLYACAIRFSSISSWTINKLLICTKPPTQKNIHTNTNLYKCPQSHIFTAGLCYIFFSIVINDYVQAGCVRINCSAKGYGQIPNRFCSRISFEEPNSGLLILCR
jgi:hypothetical protein